MTSTCLYIAYRPAWGDNRACDLLRALDHAVEVRCPARGDPLPETPDGYTGVLVGGALDDVIETSRPAYVDRLIGLTRACLEDTVPFVGFCFGAQVLAAAGGGRVLVRADGRGAFGYRAVTPAGHEGRRVLDGLECAYHLHYHGIEAPPAAARLAAGSLFPDSAFRLGPSAWGFQFHPEIRADQVEAVLADLGEGVFARPGADPRARHLDDAATYDAGVHTWLQRFLQQSFGPA